MNVERRIDIKKIVEKGVDKYVENDGINFGLLTGI